MSKHDRKVLTTEQQRNYEVEVSNAVYQATAGIYERLELEGVMFGNGHHAAQDAAKYAAEILRARWNK